MQHLLTNPAAVPGTLRELVARSAHLANTPPQDKTLADAVLERLLQAELERVKAVDTSETTHQNQAARLQSELREVRWQT